MGTLYGVRYRIEDDGHGRPALATLPVVAFSVEAARSVGERHIARETRDDGEDRTIVEVFQAQEH